MSDGDSEKQRILLEAKDELVVWAKTRFTTVALLLGVVSLFGVGALVNSAVQATLQDRLTGLIESAEGRVFALESRLLDTITAAKERSATVLAGAELSEALASEALEKAALARDSLQSLGDDISNVKDEYDNLIAYAQSASDITYYTTQSFNQNLQSRRDHLAYIDQILIKMRDAIDGLSQPSRQVGAHSISKILEEIKLAKRSFDDSRAVLSDNNRFKVIVYRQNGSGKNRENLAEDIVDELVFLGFQAELWRTDATSSSAAAKEIASEFGIDTQLIEASEVGGAHHPTESAIADRIQGAIKNIKGFDGEAHISPIMMEFQQPELRFRPRKYEYEDDAYFSEDNVVLVWILESNTEPSELSSDRSPAVAGERQP